MRRIALLAVDVICVAVATLAALFLRDNLEFDSGRLVALLPYLGISVAVAIPILIAFGMDRLIWRHSALKDHLRSMAAISIIVVASTSVGFVINRLEGVARSLPILQALTMVFLFVGLRVAFRLYGQRISGFDGEVVAVTAQAMGMARLQETVLVVGVNRLAELYLRSISELAPDRFRVAGLLGHDKSHEIGQIAYGLRILGKPEDLPLVLGSLEVHGITVNRIAVMMPFDQLSETARAALLDIEQRQNIQLDLITEMIGLNSRPASPGKEPLASLDEGEITSIQDRPYWRVKRCLDAAVAATLLTLTAPLILLVCIAVVVDVGFPAIFWQIRPGRLGYPFKLLKFRSMSSSHDRSGRRVPDSERSSIIGRVLRRLRLDELPQLMNILSGKMSLVGPRPLLPVDQPEWDFTRLLVRPGLTGWAQVNGGRFVSVSEKAALDVWYVRNASLWLDIRILARTLVLVVRGERRNERAIAAACKALNVEQQTRANNIAADASDRVEAELPAGGRAA